MLLALAVLAVAHETDAWTLIESDDFTGTDGDAPDPKIWGYYEDDSNDAVKLDGNKVRTTVVSSGQAYIYNAHLIYVKNFTLIIDWQPKKLQGRACGFRLLSNNGAYVVDFLAFNYDSETYGWTIGKRSGGSWTTSYSYTRNMVVDTWYTVNITMKETKFDLSVVERSSGTVKYSKTDQSIDRLGNNNRFRIGTFASISSHNPDAFFDNYTLYMIGDILAPKLTSPSNGTVFNSTPSLQWSVGHITDWTFQSYRVQIDNNADMGSPAVDTGTVSSSATTYQPSALGEGTWYWRVKVENTSTIWSKWSFVRYFIIDLTPPRKVGAPSDGGVWSNSKTLSFSWSAATDAHGIKGYYVRVGTTPGGSDAVKGAFTTSRSYSLAGCKENTTYYISVAAKDVPGNVGEWSDPSDGITIDTIAPGTTTVHDEGTYSNRSFLFFDWAPVTGDFSGIDVYLVYVGTSPNNANLINGLATTMTSYNLTVHSEGRTYYAWVRVRDKAGNVGASSGPSDGITVDWTGPTAPVVTDEGVYSTVPVLNFTWTASIDLVSRPDHYLVSIGTTPGGNDVLSNAPEVDRYRLLAGAVDGTTYYARVRAMDMAGNLGPWSDSTDGITVDMTPPTAPAAADEGEWCTGTSTRFTWGASTDGVSGLAHYLVQVGTTPGEGDVVTDLLILGRNYTLTNMEEGVTYYCTVRGVDVAGNLGEWGTPSDGITVDTEAPVARRAVPAGRWSTDGRLSWTWPAASDEVSGLARYRVYVGTTPLGDDVVSGLRLEPTSIGYTLSNGTHGVTYYLRLEAVDVAGNVGPTTDPSSPITVDTRVEAVSRVGDDGRWSTDPVLAFDWYAVDDDVSGVAGYRVFLGTSPDALAPLEGLVVNGTSFTYLDGEDGTTYYLAVSTVDVAGNEAPLSPVTDGITVDMTGPDPVSVRDGGEWSASTILTFEWDEPGEADLIDLTIVSIRTSTGASVGSWELEGVATSHQLVGAVDGVTYACQVRFRDLAGNLGPLGDLSDGITVDLTPPTQVIVTPPPAIVLKGPIKFEWTTATDGGSGLTGYEVSVGMDEEPHDATTMEGTTYTLMEPHGNGTYYCRVRALDLAGNAGPWSSPHQGVYVYDDTPDVRLEINGGTLMTASPDVTLVVGYEDLLDAVDMRIYEGEDMAGVEWGPFATTSMHVLQGRDGTHTLHVQVRNGLGVVGDTSASIILDTTPPAIIFETKDGKATEEETITVRGTTEPSATLEYAGTQVPVGPDGSFEVKVPLVIGKNLVELTATDELGNSGSASITVEREPGSEWTPTTRGVSLLLLVVVLVLVAVIVYTFMRNRGGAASEWEEMPE